MAESVLHKQLKQGRNMAERFPLDYDAIRKGDMMTKDELARKFNEQPGSDAYRFKLMALQATIERELDDRGRPVTVKIHHEGLCVLTDEMASEHNARQTYLGFRRMLRSHRRNMNVDQSNLAHDQKMEHQRTLIVNGRMAQAAASGRRAAFRMAALNTQHQIGAERQGDHVQDAQVQDHGDGSHAAPQQQAG